MKLWLKILIGLVVLVIIAFLGLSAYLGATATSVARLPIELSPADLGLEGVLMAEDFATFRL